MYRPVIRLIPLLFTLLGGCAAPLPARSPDPVRVSTPPAVSRALKPTQMKPADIRAMLAHHNAVRADVGVAPLRWDEGLAAQAQQWADHLAVSGCLMRHRQPNRYGENLFQGTARHYRAIDAAQGWESEKALYRGGVITETNYRQIGHYTQMVWRGTTRLGCGEAICNATRLVTCNYDPPGNKLGRTPY